METVGAMSEGEWNFLNGICNEEADFLLGNYLFPSEIISRDFHHAASSTFWPDHHQSMNVVAGYVDHENYTYNLSDEANASTVYSFSQGSSSCNYSEGQSSVLFPDKRYYPNVVSHHFFATNNNNNMMVDYSMIENKNNVTAAKYDVMDQLDGILNQDVSNDDCIESNDQNLCEDVKNSLVGTEAAEEPLMLEDLKEDDLIIPLEISEKRTRVPAEDPRSSKNMKCSKLRDSDDDNNNSKKKYAVAQRQSSSSFCSKDDSQEIMNGGTESSKGKKRAGRGSATDPHSHYARQRRERINERLKILQSLVPNGTKVDISTMLEEAVQYIKFLQLQIKVRNVRFL